MLGLVLAINLMPAFAPPTWTVLVFLSLTRDIPDAVLVIGGALAAASGRYVLARLSRRFGAHLPERKRRDLAAVGRRIVERSSSRVLLFGLFVVSPLPSAQLFEAAGLTPQARLVPLTISFFFGRLFSYSLYVGGASVAQQSLDRVLAKGVTSPAAIALQVAMLALLAAFVFTPWARLLGMDEDEDRSGPRAKQ